MGEAAKKLEKEVEPELIPVGPGVEGEEGERHPLGAEKDEEDKKVVKDEEEGGEDTRLAGDDEDEDRPRRKETAKERRLRDKRKRSQDRQELNFYRQRNADLEKQLVARVKNLEGRQEQLNKSAVDQRIGDLEKELALADSVAYEATKSGTREDYQKAQGIRDNLNADLLRLRYAKQAAAQRPAAEAAPQQSESAPNQETVFHARQWARTNSWFDPSLGDEDSILVHALDEAVASEGFDPRTEEYWEELTRRVKRRMPEKFKANGHRADSADEDEEEEVEEKKPARQAAGPKFSSGGRERALRKGEVYISAERKAAMQKAGMWEDTAARQRMLKRYAVIDAEIAGSTGAN